jgi:YD repeat-containing protein
LWTNRTDGSFVDLILEDGNRVHYVQQNPGTGYQQWVFVNRSSPTGFLNSEMRWDAGKWKVTLLDGTVYKFLPCGNHTRQKCKLVEYQNPSGGWLRMTRDADSNLLSIVNPNSRGIAFRNDLAGRIVEGKVMGSNRTVTYSYDDWVD